LQPKCSGGRLKKKRGGGGGEILLHSCQPKICPYRCSFCIPLSSSLPISPILQVNPLLRKGYNLLHRKSTPAATFFFSLLFSSTISFLPPRDLISTENSNFFSSLLSMKILALSTAKRLGFSHRSSSILIRSIPRH
jgi:hypothetical protein